MAKPKPAYPMPMKFGPGCTRFRLSATLAYEAECAGEVPERIPADQERYLTARQLAARHGVSEATVWRRAAQIRQAPSKIDEFGR